MFAFGGIAVLGFTAYFWIDQRSKEPRRQEKPEPKRDPNSTPRLPAREIPVGSDANGLPLGAQSLIAAVLARHPEVAAAVLLGSRARGSHRPESDIDLMLEGALTPLDAQRIAAELEELPVPQKFDIRTQPGFLSPDLQARIRRVGRVIYRRRVERG